MRKVVSILLVLCILAPYSVYTSPKAYAANSNFKVAGKCYYASETHGDKDFKISYYYNDAYFTKTAYDEDPSLTTMSMVLAMAGGRSNRTSDWSKKPQNLIALWKDIGFTNISTNADYRNEPKNDTTGIACASKVIKENGSSYTLISTVVNGIRLFSEWNNVLKCGSSGDFQYMANGATKVKKYIQQYIEKQKISGKIKLWMVGYGAAGGKVNLLAADLDRGTSLGSSVTLKKEDLYAYCITCPNIALKSNGLKDSVYNNIKVYNYQYDLRTHLAPVSYGFGTYGKVYNSPTKNGSSNYTQKLSSMMDMLETIEGAPDSFILDQFRMKKASLLTSNYVKDDTSRNEDLNQFMDIVIDILIKNCCPNRAAWVSDFQSDACDIVGFLYGGYDSDWSVAIGLFTKYVEDNLISVAFDVLTQDRDGLYENLLSGLRQSMRKAGVKDYDDQTLQKIAGILARVIINIGVSNINEEATFCANIQLVLVSSMDTTYQLAWLMSNDPYYQNPAKNFGSGSGKAVAMSDCKITLSKSSYVYNGKARKPSVTVTYNGKKLTKGDHYTLAYKNNKKAGTAKVVVTGKGKYTGSVTKKFTIKKAASKVSAKNLTKTYNSSKKQYTIDYEYTGDGTLKFSSSSNKIKVSSSGKVTVPAKYIGKATITITHDATTNYKSSSTKITVRIKPTKTEIESVSNSSSKCLTIKWKKNSIASKYEIQCATNSDFPDYKSYTARSSSTSFNVKGIPVGTKVYVRMRTVKMVNDKKYTSSWSGKKSIKIKK